MNPLSNEDAKKILYADLNNIITKVKAGKTLTKGERELFEKHTETTAPEASESHAKSLTDLADKLGVALRTVQRWKKRYSDAPRDLSIEEWIKFRNLVHGPREEENLAAKKARSDIRRNELACEKLELEIEKIKGQLVPRTEVRADGAGLGAILKSSFSKLEKEMAGRLEGKTPEERLVEIRKAIAESIETITHELKKIGEADYAK